MDTRSLAAFSAVYELGSISKASQKLFISTQGLSKIISRLETELGQTLFIRTFQGVTPTAFARSLYPEAQKIGILLDSIGKDSIQNDSQSLLSIASTSSYMFIFKQSFYDEFHVQNPRIKLIVTESSDRDVAKMVSSGVSECGLMAAPVDFESFDATLFNRHPYVLVVNCGDPLANRRKIGFRDLDGRKLAIIGRGFSPYDYIMGRLTEAGVVLDEIIETAEINVAVNLAAQARAVCIDADFSAWICNRENTKIIPFEDESFSWDTYFIARKDTRLSDEALAFRRFAFDWCAKYGRNIFTVEG